jgi:ATP-binding cassette subfamily F protein uup
MHCYKSLPSQRVAAPCCSRSYLIARPTITKAAREVLLIADDVTKSYDEDKQLFSGLTFSVVEGDKLAIVGTNGSGKSTLLKIMAGLDDFDAGAVQRNKGAKIGYLMQEPVMNETHTVLQAVLQSDSAVARAVQAYQKAVASSSGDAVSKELEKAIDLMNTFSPTSWEIDGEAKRILNSVGISDKLFATPVSKLSGGQRKRVALASCLLGKPDLLVLDEPVGDYPFTHIHTSSPLPADILTLYPLADKSHGH